MDQTNTINTDFTNLLEDVSILIFKVLDKESLINCRLVSKSWKNRADYVGKHYGHWERIAKDKILNSSYIKQKTNLNWLELYVNYQLWKHLPQANFRVTERYKGEYSAINVYRDNLIISNGSIVRYLKVDTLNEWRCHKKMNKPSQLVEDVKRRYFDFNETDELIIDVNFDHYHDVSNCIVYNINLYRKEFVLQFDLQNQDKHLIENVVKYRLENEKLYVITVRGEIFEYYWNKTQFDEIFLARTYDNIVLWRDLKVWRNDLFLMCDANNFRVDSVTKHIIWPGHAPDEPTTDMFLDVVNSGWRNRLNPIPTCSVYHAQTWISGYANGNLVFQNYLKRGNRYCKTDGLYNFIKGMDVCEVKESHLLFVLTPEEIIKTSFVYPESLKAEYRNKISAFQNY